MEKGPGLISLQVTGLSSGSQDRLIHSAKQSNLWKRMFFSSTDSMKVGGIIKADKSALVFTAPHTDLFNQNPLLHPVMLLLSSNCHWRSSLSRILKITLLTGTTSWSEDPGYIAATLKGLDDIINNMDNIQLCSCLYTSGPGVRLCRSHESLALFCLQAVFTCLQTWSQWSQKTLCLIP